MDDCIWPERTWPLRQLTEDQYAAWERDGYLVLPDTVPLDLCANAAAVIRRFIGAVAWSRQPALNISLRLR